MGPLVKFRALGDRLLEIVSRVKLLNLNTMQSYYWKLNKIRINRCFVCKLLIVHRNRKISSQILLTDDIEDWENDRKKVYKL